MVERLILIFSALLLAISASAALPSTHLLIDLLSHFRFQYFGAAGLGVLLICLIFMRTRTRLNWALGLFLIAGAINGWALWPYVPTGGAQAAPAGSFKVAVANLLGVNRKHDAVLSFVREESPDLLVLLETNDRWIRAMEPLKKIYPHSVSLLQTRNFGLMIFSRVPLNDVETRYFDQFPNIPTVFFNLSIDGKNYRVAAVHAAPPVNVPINMAEFQAAKSLTMTTVGEIQLSLRNAHLRAVADWISTKAGSILVVGDLNTTPYSHAFENFISTSGLKDARKGRGFLPTWGPLSPWPLRLPIDHILLSKGLEATSLNVGPDVGSDHRPLIAVLKPSINALVQKQTD